ncbi:MAG: hypothetical protein IJQ43_07215 [Oscillospiraceae bacterium]|nr:hypothetical protein [Oscillospiraceae bacterium]
MERKKSLRILAGIFLLIGLVLGLASILISFFINSRYGSFGFFRVYGLTLVRDLILLAIIVFIFRRLYLGAGIGEGVLALWSFLSVVSAVISLVKGMDGSYRVYSIGSMALSLISAGVGVMFMIGFFKHGRASKGLFILGAILELVTSLVGGILPMITFNAGYSRLATILTTLGSSLLLGSFSFLAWLFLGLYFGAQREDEAVQPQPEQPEPGLY